MRLFYGGLLLKSAAAFGAVWAWRITRLVHALPFLAGAYVWGWFSVWLWGDAFPRYFGGALCAGVVALGMAATWFREWWRG